MVPLQDKLEDFYITKNIKSTFLNHVFFFCRFFIYHRLFYVTDPSTICTAAMTKAPRLLRCI